ncbi:hypothetical protein [Ammoniphilus sp. YIM 78166]|uniref:hypothetical protein n=1 Tax=Ammoniphilus sp. YIM 78166 TaxID=1644106 RepID=UPI00106F86EA|nr:hypothetical protein [Ammoniphilus sp. YIM 78166]
MKKLIGLYIKSQGGYLLLYVLFIIALAGVLTPVLLQTTFQAYKNVVRSGDDTQAINLAEGALEIGYRVLLSRYLVDNYQDYDEKKFTSLLAASSNTVNEESAQLSKGRMRLDYTYDNQLASSGELRIELIGVGISGNVEKKVTARVELAPMTFSGGAPLIIHQDAMPTFSRMKDEQQLLSLTFAPHISPKEPNLISGSELSLFRPLPGTVVQITENGGIVDESTGSNKAYITDRVIRAETIKMRVHQSTTYVVNQFLICDHIQFSQNNNSPLEKVNNINNGLLVFKSFGSIANPFPLRLHQNQGRAVPPLNIFVSSNNKTLNNLEGKISNLVPKY